MSGDDLRPAFAGELELAIGILLVRKIRKIAGEMYRGCIGFPRVAVDKYVKESVHSIKKSS